MQKRIKKSRTARGRGRAPGWNPKQSFNIVNRLASQPIRREPGPSRNLLVGGYPDQKRVTLRYTEQISMTSTTGAIASQTFRGNSPFDPNQTGTGGQPANYDDWTAIYNRYCVLGSRISVQPTVTTNISVGVRYVLAATDGAVTGDVDDVSAQPYSVSGSYNIYATSPIIYAEMSTMKRFGKSKSQILGDPNMNALFSANPAQVWAWEFNLQSSDHATTVASYITFTIDYDIVFWERVDPGLNLLKHGPLKVQKLRDAADKLEKRIAAKRESKETKHERKEDGVPPMDLTLAKDPAQIAEQQYVLVPAPKTQMLTSSSGMRSSSKK
jgi:hypothetical protein